MEDDLFDEGIQGSVLVLLFSSWCGKLWGSGENSQNQPSVKHDQGMSSHYHFIFHLFLFLIILD